MYRATPPRDEPTAPVARIRRCRADGCECRRRRSTVSRPQCGSPHRRTTWSSRGDSCPAHRGHGQVRVARGPRRAGDSVVLPESARPQNRRCRVRAIRHHFATVSLPLRTLANRPPTSEVARNFGHVNAVRARVPSLRMKSNVSFWIELQAVRTISPSVLVTMSGPLCGSATGWPDLALHPAGPIRREPCMASGLSAKDGQPRPCWVPRRVHVLTSGLPAVCDAPCRWVPQGARILVGRMSLPIWCCIY